MEDPGPGPATARPEVQGCRVGFSLGAPLTDIHPKIYPKEGRKGLRDSVVVGEVGLGGTLRVQGDLGGLRRSWRFKGDLGGLRRSWGFEGDLEGLARSWGFKGDLAHESLNPETQILKAFSAHVMLNSSSRLRPMNASERSGSSLKAQARNPQKDWMRAAETCKVPKTSPRPSRLRRTWRFILGGSWALITPITYKPPKSPK